MKITSKCNILTFGKIGNVEKSNMSISIFESIIFPLTLLFNIVKIFFFIKKNNINKNNTIIYTTTKKSYLIAIILKLFFDFKIINHIHNFYQINLSTKILRKYFNKAYKNILVSNTLNANLRLKNSIVIYNPTGSKEKHNRNVNTYNVCTMSQLIKWKGVDDFIKSSDYVKTKNVNYLIYGKGNQLAHLKDLSMNIENIKFMGFCNNVDEIYKHIMDVLVVPSNSEEACPMSILEALSYGIPVITTNIGGQADLISHNKNGFLVDVSSPKEIAKYIDQLEDNNFYNQISLNSYKSSEIYHYKFFKESIINLFKEVETIG